MNLRRHLYLITYNMYMYAQKCKNIKVMEMFVPHVVDGKESKVIGTYFYVLVDNALASWHGDGAVIKPDAPVW